MVVIGSLTPGTPRPWDAAVYYCPYVPLIVIGGTNNEDTKIAFKTRYNI
jgi:DhnA family fructose-bisphosphate aldolase class Ia